MATHLKIMTAIIPVTGSTYHPRTPTPLTNLIHLRLGETTHREKPLSHDLLAKLVRHITIGKPRRAESATSDRHSRVCQSPFPSLAPPVPPAGATCLPSPLRPRFALPSSLSRSLTIPGPLPPLSTTRFFLLTSKERASPPRRKEKQQRTHAPPRREGGRSNGGHCHERSLFHDDTRHHSTTPTSSCRDHEGPSNNRAMRRTTATAASRILSYILFSPPLARRLRSTRSTATPFSRLYPDARARSFSPREWPRDSSRES